MNRDARIFVGIMAGILTAGVIGHVLTDPSTTARDAAGSTRQTSTIAPTASASPSSLLDRTTRPRPTGHASRAAPPPATVLALASPQSSSAVDNAPPVGCGVEREDLKVGRDPGAAAVPLTPKTSTIAALSDYPNDTSAERVAPVETTVWRISAHLTDYKAEPDSDIHLVIRDNQGRTMIAELADPGCAQGSPWLRQITAARRAFDSALDATSSFHSVDIPVTVEGVGFFDYDHGQRGVAPNAVELHPVLAITFD